MPLITLNLSCPVHASFRVAQIEGMFDLPQRQTLSEHFTVEVPDINGPWQIGAIVGPSGSGKTSVARAAFGDALYAGGLWPADRAVIDCFGELPIRTITQTLTAVGFSSPPAWIKPFAVLSNGEKFRCELARALLRKEDKETGRHGDKETGREEDNNTLADHGPGTTPMRPQDVAPGRLVSVSPCPPVSLSSLTVFDEFTSLVDRTVARIGSAAVSSAIRKGKIPRRFVAVSCHYDIVPWLAPDWVLDMATQTLSREALRRPPIRLDIRRCQRSAWPIFQRHHYLSGNLHPSAMCFIACVEDRPAAFTAALPFPHPRRPGWREHRTVCLPDFQGVGIGSALAEFVASLFVATGKPYFSTSSHPAVIHHRARSPLWVMRRRPGMVSRMGRSGAGKTGMGEAVSLGRLTAGFEYVGRARVTEARELDLVN
jgi:hypothetical protein